LLVTLEYIKMTRGPMNVKFIQVLPVKHKGNFNTSSGCSKLAHKDDE